MGCGMSCGGFGKTFADILTSYERLSMWLALAAVVTCIVSTLILMVSVGIGLGYNYCYVAYSTHQLDPPPEVPKGNSSGSGRRGLESEDTRRNIFPHDFKSFRRHPDTFVYQGDAQPLHYVMRRSVTQQVVDSKQENAIKESPPYINPWLKKRDVGQRHIDHSIRSNQDALHPFVQRPEEANKIANDNFIVPRSNRVKMDWKQRIRRMKSFGNKAGPMFQPLKDNAVKNVIEHSKNSTFLI